MRTIVYGAFALALFAPLVARAGTPVDALVDREAAFFKASTVNSDEATKLYAVDSNFALGDTDLPGGSQIALIAGPDGGSVSKFVEAHRTITMSRDGQSAWISRDVHLVIDLGDGVRDPSKKLYATDYRASAIAAKTPAGWRFVDEHWTIATPNAAVNADAKAGKLTSARKTAPDGDASLVTAFTALLDSPFDADALARTDLVAFGSGPGERTVGGASLGKAWAAAWAKHLTVEQLSAFVAPSGTTGRVDAQITLTKGTGKAAYTIPFHVYFVFDKTKAGAWSLVHANFAV
jgi:ketosteroid isomerase-like protein